MVASYEFRKRYDPGYLGLFKSKAMLKRLCYGFYAMGLQQFGGIAALTMVRNVPRGLNDMLTLDFLSTRLLYISRSGGMQATKR